MVTTIRLPDRLHGDLKQEAEEKGLTLNALIVTALWSREKEQDAPPDEPGDAA